MMTVSSSYIEERPVNTIPKAVARFLVLVGISTLFIALASGEEVYCAFEVHVSAPSGGPISKVPVAILKGHKFPYSETTTAANGVANLCDAPLEPVDIVVGFDVCGTVMVRNLKPRWPETQRVFVTYAQFPCDHFGAAPGCQVLLRIQDERGHPVAGARFDGKPFEGNSSSSNVTDVLGRLFLSLKRGERLEGLVAREGSQSSRVSALCEDDLEVKVILRNH